MKPKKKHTCATTSSDNLMVEKKKRRRSSNGVDDLISELPDPIIHHIFSFLDMTTVIQTCFLSKRWRYLWTTLPFLNFNKKVYDSSIFRTHGCLDEDEYLGFVERVLIFRKNQKSNVHTFRFNCAGGDTLIVYRISTWMHILTRWSSNVQVVDLQIDSSGGSENVSFKLPMSLYTCKSLTVLKLDLVDRSLPLWLDFENPAAISLPALKTLHLKSLWLKKSVEFLISTSPVLETLIMNDCFFDGQELNIFNPQIKSLTIERMNSDPHHESIDIKVFAPNLKSFTSAADDIINRYSFVNVSSPAKPEIDIDLSSNVMVQSDVYPAVAIDNGEGDDLDLISKLPDSLVEHILSYLDMSTVIQTCVLSKRWRYIWSSLPFLNFDLDFHSSSFELFYFITRVLIFRNQNSNIQTFRVSHWGDEDNYYNCCNSTHIVTWIHILNRICTATATATNDLLLQAFDIQTVSPSDFIIRLPTCFQSLTTLKLDLSNMINFEQEARPSFLKLYAADGTTLCLPALKTLHLKSMCLKNWVDVEMLIAGSPVLQNLVFSNCFYQIGSPLDLMELNIWHAQLQSLVIDKMYSYDKVVEKYFYYYSYESCRFNVFAPKLVSFISRDHFDLINGYSFVNIASLDNAEIYTVLDLSVDSVLAAGKDQERKFRKPDLQRLKKRYIANVMDCLRGIYKVRSLKISAWLLELVTEVPGGLESLPMAPFYNLRILKLKTTSSKYQIRAGMYLLEKCPSLQTLILKMTVVKSVSVEEEECWEAELAPQCIMRNLKLVEIRNFLASANEFEFLKFLLKNAIALEKLKVLSSKKQPPDTEDLKIFGAKLKSVCGAASSRTEILFQ